MLASNGSVAEQVGGFKGIVWKEGNNPFSLPFVGQGLVTNVNTVTAFRPNDTPSDNQNFVYGINLSTLNIKTNTVRIRYISYLGPQARVVIRYITGADLFVQLPAVGYSFTNITTDPTRIISRIDAWNQSGDLGIIFSTAISEIEIL